MEDLTDLDLIDDELGGIVNGEVVDDHDDAPEDAEGEAGDGEDTAAPVFYMRWGKTLVRIDVDEFTALDFQRFRETTGLNLMTIQAGNLEAFAGALWLKLRRGNKKLRYTDVAKRVRWSNLVDEETARAELRKAGGDPER